MIDAAAVLFAQGGYQAVSVAQILELSGVKAPSLYHHFGDKEGLYIEWALATLDKVGDRLRQANSVPELVSAVVEGAHLDLLQLQRDLRDLQKAENRDLLRTAIETHLVQPAIEAIRPQHLDESPEDVRERANFLLHAAMYAHPAYSSQRKGTRINGGVSTWIAKLVDSPARRPSSR